MQSNEIENYPATNVAFLQCTNFSKNATRSSTDAEKTRATHLEVSQGHQTVPFYMLGIFLLCNCL